MKFITFIIRLGLNGDTKDFFYRRNIFKVNIVNFEHNYQIQ